MILSNIQQFVPTTFPGEGLIYQPSQRGGGESVGVGGLQGGGDLSEARLREEDAHLVASSTPIQQREGHVIAYAGFPVSLQYEAVTNWCQSEHGELIEATFRNGSCARDTNGSVSIEFGPLPTHDVFFTSIQSSAITDMMITFDNPFASARPNHQYPVGYLQRNFNSNPQAAEAAKLNYTRINYNLNRGAGGADVSLWVRRVDPSKPPDAQGVITDVGLSTNAAEEALLSAKGYRKVQGNLNTEAGGDDVYLWYQRSSGHLVYNPQLPHELGLANPIVDIAFISSADPVTDTPPPADAGWIAVSGSLNSGLVNAPSITLYHKHEVQKQVNVKLTWTPCACDVGERTVCAYAVETILANHQATPVRGPTQCTVIHVLPALPPDFINPTPPPDSTFVYYIAQERKIKLAAMTSSAAQEFEWIFENMPLGMDVAPQELSQCGPPGVGGGAGAGEDGGMGGVGCWERQRTITWVPAWNQGGLKIRGCVSLRIVPTGCEPTPALGEPVRCYTFEVARCVYAVQEQQMVQEIASLYHTSWLNVYSLNPSMKTPDRVMSRGQLINIGHLYSVVPGDTLHKIGMQGVGSFYTNLILCYTS
jgi:hypothetical protein